MDTLGFIRKKILRPVFALAADAPLYNPHSPYETELLLKGAKPTAIVDKGTFDQLQDAIHEDRIVITGHKKIIDYVNLYVPAGEMERVKHMPEMARRGHDLNLSPEDHTNIENIFSIPADLSERPYPEELIWRGMRANTRQRLFKESFDDPKGKISRSDNFPDPDQIQRTAVKQLLANELPFIADIENFEQHERSHYDDLVDAGVLERLSFPIDRKMDIYIVAQAGKTSEGEELANLWFNPKATDGETLKKNWRRIGQLLGYDSEDIAMFMEEKPEYKHRTEAQTPLAKYLEEKIADIRHWARKERMLIDADNPGSELT